MADRVRLCLKHAPAERLSFAPDCGLSQTARWAARQKLANLVSGVAIVRKELGLRDPAPMSRTRPIARFRQVATAISACGGLGQSGFLLEWQGAHVLLDPYLSDSLTMKLSETDKPHVRMTELVIDPARLWFADIATSSHNHTDHLDAETLSPILAGNPRLKLVIAEANRAFVADRLRSTPRFPLGRRWKFG